MKNKKSNLWLYFVLIILFSISSCKSKGYLPDSEYIPYNKTDYNGFYEIGENGKKFKLLNDSTITFSVIKDKSIAINRIKKAAVMFNSYNDLPAISIELDEKGTKQFAELSRKNIGKNIAFIFNNKLFICPIVNEAIEKGKVQITSSLSLQKTVNIVAYINENCNK